MWECPETSNKKIWRKLALEIFFEAMDRRKTWECDYFRVFYSVLCVIVPCVLTYNHFFTVWLLVAFFLYDVGWRKYYVSSDFELITKFMNMCLLCGRNGVKFQMDWNNFFSLLLSIFVSNMFHLKYSILLSQGVFH